MAKSENQYNNTKNIVKTKKATVIFEKYDRLSDHFYYHLTKGRNNRKMTIQRRAALPEFIAHINSKHWTFVVLDTLFGYKKVLVDGVLNGDLRGSAELPISCDNMRIEFDEIDFDRVW